jgi:sarcosine oxidase
VDFDVVICGLGAMGSAAAYHLASAGLRVLGLDQFHPPHEKGSSQGKSRIIREAYFEHPAYVPLVQRAYELWADLEKKSRRKLLIQTGGLMIGPEGGALVAGAKRSAEEHALKHRMLASAKLRQEFPLLAVRDEIAVWEPRAGILFPELCIQAHLDLAIARGASLRFGQRITGWEVRGSGVSVSTESEAFSSRQLLVSAGAWLSSLLPDLRLPLSVERQVLFWFEPQSRADSFKPDRLPIFIWENELHKYFYGFPDLGDGIKIGVHHQGEITTPDRLNRDVSAKEIAHAHNLLKRHVPDAAGDLKSAVVCMYTNTPDEHFILDWHPAHRQVLIASPCSGHGFKFSAVIGEIASQMLQGEETAFDLNLFRIGRFVTV